MFFKIASLRGGRQKSLGYSSAALRPSLDRYGPNENVTTPQGSTLDVRVNALPHLAALAPWRLAPIDPLQRSDRQTPVTLHDLPPHRHHATTVGTLATQLVESQAPRTALDAYGPGCRPYPCLDASSQPPGRIKLHAPLPQFFNEARRDDGIGVDHLRELDDRQRQAEIADKETLPLGIPVSAERRIGPPAKPLSARLAFKLRVGPSARMESDMTTIAGRTVHRQRQRMR